MIYQFQAMPNNPFVSEKEGGSGVTSGVVSLDLVSEDGDNVNVKESDEPFRIELPSES